MGNLIDVENVLRDMYNHSADGRHLVEVLEENGFRAFFVGGVIRDTLLHHPVKDIDIATSASVEEICQVLEKNNIAYIRSNSFKFGTVMCYYNGSIFDITTFGTHSDLNDRTNFNLQTDLMYRDFSINAMAYNPKTGLVDPYGGLQDLNWGIIKATYSNNLSLRHDKIRILRALRLAAKYDFKIGDSLLEDMAGFSPYVARDCSPERIGMELCKLFAQPRAVEMIEEVPEAIYGAIPDLRDMVDYNQNNPHHVHDLFTHTLLTMYGVEKNIPSTYKIACMFAALLHDVGKPSCATLGEDGITHFYGHAEVSAEMADNIMGQLAINKTITQIATTIIRLHDYPLEPTKKSILRMLNKIKTFYDGDQLEIHDIFMCICDFKAIDGASNLPIDQFKEGVINLDTFDPEMREVVSLYSKNFMTFDCTPYCAEMLPIGGDFLIENGMKPSPHIGKVLDIVVRHLINGKIDNNIEDIKADALSLINNFKE